MFGPSHPLDNIRSQSRIKDPVRPYTISSELFQEAPLGHNGYPLPLDESRVMSVGLIVVQTPSFLTTSPTQEQVRGHTL